MPKEHDYLPDAMRDLLKDNVKAVADAWGFSERYIYQIIAEERTDPTGSAVLLMYYEKLCRRGVSTTTLDDEFALLRAKHARRGGVRQPGEAIQQQFHEFSHFTEEFMRGISDGSLDLVETERLLDILAVLEPMVKTSKESLIAHKAKIGGK